MAENGLPELYRAVHAFTFNENLLKFSPDKEYITSMLPKELTVLNEEVIGKINVTVNRTFSAKFSSGPLMKGSYSNATMILTASFLLYGIALLLLALNSYYYHSSVALVYVAFTCGLVGMLLHFFVIFKNARIGSVGSSMMSDKTEINKIVNDCIESHENRMKKLGFCYYYDSHTIRIFIMPVDPSTLSRDSS